MRIHSLDRSVRTGSKLAVLGLSVAACTFACVTWSTARPAVVKPVRPSASIKAGTYTLTPQHAKGERMDATGGSRKTGTSVQIWKANSGPNQKWVITPTGGGLYKIQPAYDKDLAVSVNGSLKKDGTQVILENYKGGAGQQWSLHASTGGYSFAPKCAPGSRLDVMGLNGANGTKLQIWSATGKPNQTWAIGK